MRSRFTLLAACVLALALPSTASAAFTVGISENQPSMFGDPLFQQVGFKQARVIVGYDVALDPNWAEAVRLTQYLASAQGQGIEPRANGGGAAHAKSGCRLHERVLPLGRTGTDDGGDP